MIEQNLFRNLIYKDTFEFDLQKLLPTMKQSLFQDGVPSADNYETTPAGATPHHWPEFHEFLVWAAERAEKIAEDWELLPLEKYIASSHVNRQVQGQYVREHSHPGVDIVIVAYISAEENSGNIEFRDPLEYAWQNLPKDTHPRDVWREVKIKTGDVLFFPGFLNHRTQINTSGKDRWTLNTMIRSRIG